MNKRMIPVLLCASLALAVMFAGTSASAAGSVTINATNFPDRNFRKYVIKNFDLDKNDVLSEAEIKKVTSIDCTGAEINDLKGIEFFPYLTSLDCSGVYNVNWSSNKAIKKLICSSCHENEYDFSMLTDLETLDCSYIFRTAELKLDLKKNTKLTKLNCSHCDMLCELDLSKNTALKYLNCSGCSINEIDLKANVKLEELDISERNRDYEIELDLSKNKALKKLDCYDSGICKLNIASCTLLEELDCSSNYNRSEEYALKQIDISKNTKLKKLYCNNNSFESLDLSKNTGLEILNCRDSGISKLDLSNNKNLKELECSNNGITSLDLTNNKSLKSLDCYSCKITKIVFSQDSALEHISCYANKLNNLDVSSCKSLKKLECSGNDTLTDLKISGCTSLVELMCTECKIKAIDASGLSSLMTITCRNNKIASLKVSGCSALERIDCIDNQLTSLNIKDCKKLGGLYCYGNKISSLDINYNASLLKAYWDGVLTNEKRSDDYGTYNVMSYYFTPPFGDADYSKYGYLLEVDKTTKIDAKEPVVIKLDKDSANVVCGKSVTVKSSISGSKSQPAWKSSNTKIATVDSNGKITGKMAGFVTVTASIGTSSASCKIRVLYKDMTNPEDFYYEPTYYLTDKGVVKGYDKQTKFKPANNCTRAQMVTFIWRLMGEPDPKTKTCKFKDVKKTDYFYKACIWGNENHIVEGYKDGTFGPQIVCARKHAVTFLWRLAKQPEPKTKTNKFSDVKKSDYFYKATLWASEKGILAGYDDNTFRPNGDCLRRQMVTFLYKYDKFVNGKG
ncbi:MAG: leucine-rich repeat domain-containing protein [Clostridiales bacterium]|nr:leucine-rich repeat domain-containing protein [Clostridiales bacterium]